MYGPDYSNYAYASSTPTFLTILMIIIISTFTICAIVGAILSIIGLVKTIKERNVKGIIFSSIGIVPLFLVMFVFFMELATGAFF